MDDRLKDEAQDNQSFEDWAAAFPITNLVPHSYGTPDKMPDDIYGAEILEFGHLNNELFSGGGLGLRYKTRLGETKTILFDVVESGLNINDRRYDNI